MARLSSGVSLWATRGAGQPRIGWRTEDFGDAFRNVALPVRPDQQIKARRGAVHLAELDEAVGAEIDHLIHPETVAEIRHLEYDRRNVERKCADAVDDILIWTCDRAFFRIDIVGKHGKAIGGGLHQWPANRHLLDLREIQAAVI
jgi:hypothetical protein